MRCLLNYHTSVETTEDGYVSIAFRKNVRTGNNNLRIWHKDPNMIP
jgi:hypothetical protein